MKRAHVAKPCADCPFRRDGGIRLYRDRLVQILDAVAPRDGRGCSFPCHKTVDQDERDPSSEKQCAGALIMMYKLGESTQMSRIEERLGMIDPALAEGDWPEIFNSRREMIASALPDRAPVKRARARRAR